MSHQKRRQLSLEFMSELSCDGKTKEKSSQSRPQVGKDATTSNHIQEHSSHQLELPLFTLESAVEDSPKTSQDKSSLLENSIQEQKSFPKLEEDLTSKDRNFLHYWNESCQEISRELLSLTETGWQDSGSIGLTGSVKSLTVKSWFSTKQTYLQKQKWSKISSPSSTVSVADCTDSENTKLRSRKIKIYPSPELKKLWNKWIAACRYCFNEAIAYQKKHGQVSKLKLRNIIMQSELPQWVKETPCHIRQNAIFDAHQSYQASKDCKFRSCKDPKQTIKFNDSNFSQGKWYPRLTKKLSFESSEQLPQTSKYATQLIRTKGYCWFIHSIQ